MTYLIMFSSPTDKHLAHYQLFFIANNTALSNLVHRSQKNMDISIKFSSRIVSEGWAFVISINIYSSYKAPVFSTHCSVQVFLIIASI